MATNLQRRLDKEADERIDPIVAKFNNRKKIKLGDFLSQPVAAALQRDSALLISGADSSRIMTSIPFYQTVFVEICSKCAEVGDRKSLRSSLLPLLESGSVLPILLNSYSEYPDGFVKEIVRLPHLGRREFRFYRDTSILAQSSGHVCGHCVKRKLDGLLESPAVRSSAVLKDFSRRFFSLLAPHVEPDFELLDQFMDAVQKGDMKQMFQLMRLAMTVNAIRTAQGLHSAQGVPLDAVNDLPKLGNVDPLLRGLEIGELKQLAADELGLVVPASVDVEKYLDVVLPFQKRLVGLVDNIVAKTGDQPSSEIVMVVQEINEELRKIERSKRFLAYQAIAGFAAGNAGLIGGLLVSGALGVGGHLGGCAASAIATVGGKLLKKAKPIRENRSLKQLGLSIRASLQPAVAKVLAAYLGISTRAVEVWQLRRVMIEGKVMAPVSIQKRRKR